MGYKDPINPDYPATSAMYHKVDIIAISVFVNIGLVDEYSIRTKDPNNHSDTETGTLSMKKPLPLNSVGYFFWGTLQI